MTLITFATLKMESLKRDLASSVRERYRGGLNSCKPREEDLHFKFMHGYIHNLKILPITDANLTDKLHFPLPPYCSIRIP